MSGPAGLAARLRRFKPSVSTAAALALLAAHFMIAMAAASRRALTADEYAHLPAGLSYLQLRDGRMNPEHPPLPKVIAALPMLFTPLKWDPADADWLRMGARRQWSRPEQIHYGNKALEVSIKSEWGFARRFLFELNRDRLEIMKRRAAAAMAALSVATGWIVFLWTRRLWGPGAGLTALTLFAFCPNLLGHATIVHTDVASMLFTLAFLAAWRGILTAGTARAMALPAVFAAAALAGGLLSKYSNLALCAFPLLTLPLGALEDPPGERLRRLALRMGALAAAGLGAAIPMAILYGALFGEFFLSPYLVGVRIVSERLAYAPDAKFYLMGRLAERHPEYFAVTALLKMTFPALALLGISAAMGLASTAGRWAEGRSGERAAEGDGKGEGEARRLPFDPAAAYLALFVLYFFAVLTVRFPNMGVRHMFPLWPPLFMLAAGLWGGPAGSWRRRTAGVLAALHAAAAIAAFPLYLAYMNPLSSLGGKTFWLGDGNLDWGQDVPALAAYLRERGIGGKVKIGATVNPDWSYYGIDAEPLQSGDLIQPRPGQTIVLSVYFLQSNPPENLRALDFWRLETVVNGTLAVYRAK